MKDIPGWENLYAVTKTGNIWSYPKAGGAKEGKWLTQFKHRRGYLICWLSRNGLKKQVFVHQAVAKTYIDNPEHKTEVNHKNGYKHDNNVDNLEWSDRHHNMKHAYKTGLLHKLGKGENHIMAKLTEKEVSIIKHILKTTSLPLKAIAQKFNVHVSTISLIKQGKTWKEVT